MGVAGNLQPPAGPGLGGARQLHRYGDERHDDPLVLGQHAQVDSGPAQPHQQQGQEQDAQGQKSEEAKKAKDKDGKGDGKKDEKEKEEGKDGAKAKGKDKDESGK